MMMMICNIQPRAHNNPSYGQQSGQSWEILWNFAGSEQYIVNNNGTANVGHPVHDPLECIVHLPAKWLGKKRVETYEIRVIGRTHFFSL